MYLIVNVYQNAGNKLPNINDILTIKDIENVQQYSATAGWSGPIHFVITVLQIDNQGVFDTSMVVVQILYRDYTLCN